MTDLELTALAAKAFGNAPDGFSPLTDDGDALRLAVKLQLLVNTDATESQATDGKKADECELHRDSNAYAATRRAIVRAAAEIGKETK